MTTERSRLVERMRVHLERFCYPRVELSVLIVLSGLSAFLVSFALLRAGVDSMPLRYGLAGAAGYLAFLGFVRLWIAWNHSRPSLLDLDVDPGHLVDAIDGGAPVPRGGGGPSFFAGGRSGGGGASTSWGTSSSGGGSSWLEADDSLFFLVLAIAAAVGSLLTIFYVVYLAPALLAEVLVDAVIIATISKRAAQADRRDWTATLIRRTCVPALLLISFLVVGGWALQRLAPDARSIGPAIEAIRD